MIITYKNPSEGKRAWAQVEDAEQNKLIQPRHIIGHSSSDGTGSIEVKYATPETFDALRQKGFEPKPVPR